jgi:hypothetical protein
VNKAAAALDVAATTAFRWRHRFLRLTQSAKAAELTSLIEADETFFLRSDISTTACWSLQSERSQRQAMKSTASPKSLSITSRCLSASAGA